MMGEQSKHRGGRARDMNGRWTIRQSALLVVLGVLVLALGCGGSDGKASGSAGTSGQAGNTIEAGVSSGKSGALKKTRWGISRVRKRRIQISAFVPYCGEPHPEPHIERVIRHRAPGRMVLTMFVRYPPAKGACFGSEISVMRWIAVKGDPRRLTFYDGATSPPEKRQLH
jgi:hypothetical protein